MSLLKNSKYTVSANIIDQAFSMVSFLFIPNILGQNDYAQTVFISVLMSFIVLADLGMNFVYGRAMPSIYANDDINEIEEYNQTFFWFGLIMSIVGSMIVSTIYYYKYENILNAIILIFVNPLMLIVTFFIRQHTVKEDFKAYKDINIKNSFFKLLAIPLSYIFGVSGWIFSKSLSPFIVLKVIKSNIFFKYDLFNVLLIKKHLIEGLILLANFFFWNQLLNSGRLFATSSFSDNVIAQYGITSTGYTLLLGFSISVFLPVTIASLKIIKTDTKEAIEKLFNVIMKTSIPLSLVVIFAIEVAPYLYRIFFPKYEINFEILTYQLLSLMTLPLYATLGNIFLGRQQPIKLLVVYASSFGISFLSFKWFSVEFGIASAAIAQFIGVTVMGFLLLSSTFLFFNKFIDNKFIKFIKLSSVVFVPYILYFFIRSYI